MGCFLIVRKSIGSEPPRLSARHKDLFATEGQGEGIRDKGDRGGGRRGEEQGKGGVNI